MAAPSPRTATETALISDNSIVRHLATRTDHTLIKIVGLLHAITRTGTRTDTVRRAMIQRPMTAAADISVAPAIAQAMRETGTASRRAVLVFGRTITKTIGTVPEDMATRATRRAATRTAVKDSARHPASSVYRRRITMDRITMART